MDLPNTLSILSLYFYLSPFGLGYNGKGVRISIKSRGSAAKIFHVCVGGGMKKNYNEGGVYPGPDTTIHY